MSATVASNRDWRLETVYSIFTPIVDINSILSVKKRRLALPSEVVIENYDLLKSPTWWRLTLPGAGERRSRSGQLGGPAASPPDRSGSRAAPLSARPPSAPFSRTAHRPFTPQHKIDSIKCVMHIRRIRQKRR